MRAPAILLGVIPEIDIWRVANLMLKRYGDNAEAESTRRAAELAEDGDVAGVAGWRRIIDSGYSKSTTPPAAKVRCVRRKRRGRSLSVPAVR